MLLDYLIKVKGYSFLEAVETIIGHTAIQAPVYEKPQPKEENKPLLLPEKMCFQHLSDYRVSFRERNRF